MAVRSLLVTVAVVAVASAALFVFVPASFYTGTGLMVLTGLVVWIQSIRRRRHKV